MLNYLIAVVSVAALCSVWALFQIWVSKYNSDRVNLKTGCSTCNTCNKEKNC